MATARELLKFQHKVNSWAPSSARAGSTLGDTYDEKLGGVFKARIDELIKQPN